MNQQDDQVAHRGHLTDHSRDHETGYLSGFQDRLGIRHPQAIFPACEALGLPHATWLTFRRTYSSWCHDKGVPSKVIAQLIGHANVDTTLNVYTQVLEGALRSAAERVGSELFTIVHEQPGAGEATVPIS